MHLKTLAQLVETTPVEKRWRMQQERETIGILKETRCHLETNRSATHGKLYLRRGFGYI